MSTALSLLKLNIARIERSIKARDTRFVSRVARKVTVRQVPDVAVLEELITTVLAPIGAPAEQEEGAGVTVEAGDGTVARSPEDLVALGELSGFLLGFLSGKTMASEVATTAIPSLLPEVRVYLHLLVVVSLVARGEHDAAASCVDSLASFAGEKNRFTMFPLLSQVYYYLARTAELVGAFGVAFRARLLKAHRTACLRRDDASQAVLINSILRSFLHANLYEQADVFISKTTFPATAEPNQLARFLHYQGRIKAIQLDYSGAHADLEEALRKSPQFSAFGFRMETHKLMTIVKLLKGELPDKAVFRVPAFQRGLAPYFALTCAVRVGDLVGFESVTAQHADAFVADATSSLIARLRQNVIKTGLRKINVAYSRISLDDIATKVGLDSAEDAEAVVAKAIRDGVMDASINHEEGYVVTNQSDNVYATTTPYQQMARRVNFCIKIRNDAVRAMRFSEKSKKPKAAETDSDKKSDDALVEEILAEEDDDDIDDI